MAVILGFRVQGYWGCAPTVGFFGGFRSFGTLNPKP